MILQLPIFIALYSGLHRIVVDPRALNTFSYPWVHNLSWMKALAVDIHRFDSTLLGVVDLTRAAINKSGGIYWPAMVIVAGSALAQYYQSKQLLPGAGEKSRSLRTILKDASGGKQSDQSEVNAAIGRSTRYFLPAMIFIITVNIASALSLYWLVSGLTAFIQQSKVLKQDETELEAIADKTDNKTVIEGEVIPPKKKKSKKTSSKKRRRR